MTTSQLSDPRQVLEGRVGWRRLALPVVELTGADVRRFANGMFTNNVRDLPVGGAQRTAMVDDRGRVGGLLDLWLLDESRILCVLEGVDPDAFIERYDAYVFVDDVELARRDDLQVATVQGPGASAVLAAAGLPAPDPGRVAQHGQVLVARHDRGVQGYDLVGAELPELPVPELSLEALEALRVRAGVARWPVDFGEKSLPHEMGLREAYLHFEKGCYVGQETIHRVEVLGQVRKHLVRLRLPALVAAGAEVRHDGKVVGRLTSPVRFGDEVLALAVLRHPATAPGAVVQIAHAGATLDAQVLGR